MLSMETMPTSIATLRRLVGRCRDVSKQWREEEARLVMTEAPRGRSQHQWTMQSSCAELGGV